MKILKWAIGILVSLAILLFVLVKVMSESMPETQPSPEADKLAQDMLNALDNDAWDTLKMLKFTFRGEHHYIWDKENNIVVVSWEDTKVILDLDEIKGSVTQGDVNIEGEERDKLVQKAWSYWCNDSFWMFAPYKVFDPGTSRSIVNDVEYGSKGLMVTYESGGVTPGDSYLWHLGDDNMPLGYKMWVKIIPIGGMNFTWEDWQKLSGGAMVATNHNNKFLSIPMENVVAGNTYIDLDLETDPFK